MSAGIVTAAPGAVPLVSPLTLTIAQLMANYPAGPDTNGLYANVSDLYGRKSDKMLCSFDSVLNKYYWIPVRPDYTNTSIVLSNADMVLTALLVPPRVQFTADSLTRNVTHTISKINAYPSARFRLLMPGALGLFGINIAGLVGGTNVPLLANTPKEFVFDGSDWTTY